MSFGFALNRPEARGGKENIIFNLLVHADIFPLGQSFQNEIKEKFPNLHLKMNEGLTEKEKIREDVTEIRKYVSFIILSYEQIYGTKELEEI